MSEQNKGNDTWAVVEMMGHLTIAGRVTRPGEYGGLWQIDVLTRRLTAIQALPSGDEDEQDW